MTQLKESIENKEKYQTKNLTKEETNDDEKELPS